MPNDNSTPWQMLRNQLESYISGQAAGTTLDGLQIVTTPMIATWDNPTYGTWDAWQNWANNIPIWGDMYQPSTGNSASDAYFQILTNVNVPDANDTTAAAQAQELSQMMSGLQKKIGQAQTEMFQQWNTFNQSQQSVPPQFQTTFGTWYAQNYAATISPLQSQMSNLASQFAAASNKAGGGYQLLGRAHSDYNNAAYQANETTNTGASMAFRTWSLLPDIQSWLKDAKKGKGTALSLSISTSTKTDSATTFSAGASAGFSYGIFSLKIPGGGYNRQTVDTTASNFGMQWKAKSFTSIRISAGQWYSQQVLQTFKSGPWIPSGPLGPGKQTPYGPNGVYSLQPSVIYVAYQPSVAATLDQQSYDFLKTGWEGGLEIGIGPFSFGGKSSSTQSTATWNDANRSVSLQDTSEHAQVVAVLSTVMPGN
jgi:hypothetical protein